MNNENLSNVKKLLMGMSNNPSAVVALEALAKVESDFKTLSLKLETITADRDAEMRMKAKAREQRDVVTKLHGELKVGFSKAFELLEEVLNEVPNGLDESFSASELSNKIRNFLATGK